jgi:hypothetical protein
MRGKTSDRRANTASVVLQAMQQRIGNGRQNG